jgi:SAM-dependent methyltransferase
MTQNIYDNEHFFHRYSALPRSVQGLDGAPEWAALQAMLPQLEGKRVIDLGCGFGWFCRWAAAHGAAAVEGFDVSERMLERARSETQDARIRYTRADLETLSLPPECCDLTYSALALHYLADLRRLLAEARRALAHGGALVFSVEHPIYTAPRQPGWMQHASGRSVWPLDGYLDEGARSTDWLAKGVIKHHRTVADYVNALLACGFSLRRIEEWGPDAAQIAAHPEWALERERPMFLLLAARREAGEGANPAAG